MRLLVIILFIAWSIGSIWYYNCNIKGICGNETTETEVQDTQMENETPEPATLTSFFGWQKRNAEVTKGKRWKLFIDSLKGITQGNDSYLLLTGEYFSSEKAPDGFRNMGLARASSIKEELKEHFPEERLRISSRLKSTESNDYWHRLLKVDLGDKDLNKVSVLEWNNGLTIYFPSGSADAFLTEELKERLVTISKELANDGGGANIIGHTDNQGDPKENYILGQKRASIIEDLFIFHGVDKKNVRASSMGQTQPKGDNNTTEGRAINRRIEIVFNNNKNN